MFTVNPANTELYTEVWGWILVLSGQNVRKTDTEKNRNLDTDTDADGKNMMMN